MQVRGGGLWNKSIQPKEVDLLGEKGNRYGSRLFFIDLQIELAVGVKALEPGVALHGRQALHRRTYEAVFKGLSKCQLIFNEWAGERRSRSERANANNVTAALSRARHDVLHGEMKVLLIAGTGFDTRNRSRKLAVFGIVGIGNNLDGRDHVDRQVDRLSPGRWVGYIGRVHQP